MGWEEWKPALPMLTANVAFAVMNTLIKKAIDGGLNLLVLITLRQLVATLFMAPVAYFRERKTRPKMTAEIFLYLFFSAMLGAALTQYLFFLGLQYTSATFACAFFNMTPVLTFLIAIPFRLERVNLKSTAGIAKVLGTVVCLSGAMLLTLYKGVALTNTSHHIAKSTEHGGHSMSSYKKSGWMAGSVALFAGTFSLALWFLIQSKVSKKYPALYSGTALIFSLSFLQVAALSLATQRGFSSWILKKKVEIIAVIYAGVVGSGFGFLTMSWCVQKRGPVFAAAFSPLTQIIVAGIDISILHAQLFLGSVLGSVLVISGLYVLLWGKSKDAHSSEVKPGEANEEIHGPLPAV